MGSHHRCRCAVAGGICGGELLTQWGMFLTSFFGMSSFGLSMTLYRASAIGGVSFVSSNMSGDSIPAVSAEKALSAPQPV